MSEIGVIGQMYEDRRTKKRGKLVERDDKYKTLLMESEDGKSFNVSYGGFKSNWRSCDEPVETMEEALQEVEVPEGVEKPKKEKKAKRVELDINTLDNQEKADFFANIIQKYLNFAKSFGDEDMSVTPNLRDCRVSVKMGKRRLFETYAKYKMGLYNTIVPEDIVQSHKEVLDLCEHHGFKASSVNANKLTLHIKPEDVDKFLSIMKKYVLEMLEEQIVRAEEDK